MKKEQITMEFPLDSSSESILWKMIGTPMGLSVWFSDGVTVDGDEYVFTWDKTQQSAFLLDIDLGKSITYQWEEDKNTEYYFKFEITLADISNKLSLIITDFAIVDEIEDLKMLWEKQVEDLRSRTGMTL